MSTDQNIETIRRIKIALLVVNLRKIMMQFFLVFSCFHFFALEQPQNRLFLYATQIVMEFLDWFLISYFSNLITNIQIIIFLLTTAKVFLSSFLNSEEVTARSWENYSNDKFSHEKTLTVLKSFMGAFPKTVGLC